MNSLHPGGPGNPNLRRLMGVAAALSVLGLATLFWLNDLTVTGNASRTALVVSDVPATTANSFLPASTTTGVPSAESVFGGAAYSPSGEPVATF